MALSGSISTNSYDGRYLTLSWSATQSISSNQSTISWTLSANGGSSSWYYTGPVTVVINGETVYSLSSSGRYAMYSGTVASGSLAIKHNTDGTKSFTVSVSAAIYTNAVNCTGSNTFTLDAIPRYPSVSQSLASKTETSITMNWEADATCDYVEYSKDDGSSWVAVGSVNSSSGRYTISGLTQGTTYKIKTRLRRKSSQLKNTSSATSITTYYYPYASSMPNFVIGESVTIGITNPLNREFTITMVADDGTSLKAEGTYTGTKVSGFRVEAYQTFLFESIPNKTNGTYKIRIDYGEHYTQRTGGKYYVPSTSAPTIGGATYQDTNSSVINITQNNQKVVPGLSRLSVTATGISAKDYTSISSVKVNGEDMTVSGSSATLSDLVINSSEQKTLTIVATDSRGLTSSKTVNLDIVEYQPPTMSATAQRVSGFYSSTEITPTTNYTYIGSNAVTIRLQARKTSETSYSVTQNINPSGTTTVSLDNQYPWYLLFTITDSLGGSSTFTITIGKGIPLFYFDIQKASVSMDMFPSHSNAFEVNGDIYVTVDKTATSGTDYELYQALTDLGWGGLA